MIIEAFIIATGLIVAGLFIGAGTISAAKIRNEPPPVEFAVREPTTDFFYGADFKKHQDEILQVN